MEYATVLQEMYGRTNQGIKLGLEAVEAVLRVLGDPHKRMPTVIVAGTNGKGFTSSLLAATLHASGHRVGLYTSPHLLRFTERIRIDGTEISQARVCTLFEQISAAEWVCVAQGWGRQLTFFEIATVMAVLAFAEARVTIAVLEVGLGGRLDATNVVQNQVAVITAIDGDHQAYLGETIPEIAREKAGVIGPGGIVVLAPQVHQEAIHAVEEIAEVQCATLKYVPSSPPALRDLPANAYQRQGVATVATACEALHEQRITCSREALQQALKGFVWAGRYDWHPPHHASCKPGVLYDGAHNPAGMAALLQAIDGDPRFQKQPIHAVFSALADKPADVLLAKLLARVQSANLCPVSSQRSRTTGELTEMLARINPKNAVSWTVDATAQQAFDHACARAKVSGGMVLVTGSLFLIGDVMAVHLELPRDPAVDG